MATYLDQLDRVGLQLALRLPIWRIRRAAANRLGRIGDSRAAVPALIRAMRDKASDVALSAIGALITIEDPRGAEPAEALLKDTAADSALRKSAAYLLGCLRDSSSLFTLMRMLSDEDQDQDVRAACVRAIGFIGDKSASDAVAACLEDASPWVRWEAAEALACLNDIRALGPLIATLRDPTTPGSVGPDPAAQEMWQVAAVVRIGMLQYPQAFDSLKSYLPTAKERVRYFILDVLLQSKDERVFELCMELLGHNNPTDRLRAIESLGQLGRPEATPILAELLGGTDSNVAAKAAEAIGELGSPIAMGTLVSALLSPSIKVRTAAAQALGKLGDRGVIGPLEQAVDAARILSDWGFRRVAQQAIDSIETRGRHRF